MNRTKVNGLPALVFWGLVWQCAALAVGNPLLLPGPAAVLRRLLQLMAEGAFWQTTCVSIGRVLLGMVLGIALGTVLAVAACASTLAERLLAPAVTAIQATPVASFAILVLIWVDRDFVPVLICVLMVLPVMFTSVSAGIRVTDPLLLEMAEVYRLPRLRILRRIYMPSVKPHFRAACINALGLGWKASIAAEVLTVPRQSIGRMLSEGKLYVMTEDMFAWTLTVVTLSLLLQRLMLRLLERGRGHA